MINYLEILLGKEGQKLSYADIEAFFSIERSESDVLEFKSFKQEGGMDSKFESIFKAVCAFLNSEGGVLIWGAPAEQPVNGSKVCMGNLSPVNQKFEKDMLISKISGNIVPIPNGIRVFPLQKGNEFVYVIEVQKSDYSPHQTRDKYYMRLDGQNKPAPHYFVESLFKRIRFPNIGGYLKFVNVQKYIHVSPYSRRKQEVIRLLVHVFLINHSPLLNEENVKFSLISSNGEVRNLNDVNDLEISEDGSEIKQENAVSILHYGEGPFIELEIFYNEDFLINSNYQTDLLLFFGGKFSPMRNSSYRLSLSSVNGAQSGHLIMDANPLVRKKSENMLVADQNKMSEAEKVDRILGRKRKS